jgi:hypothetical protein
MNPIFVPTTGINSWKRLLAQPSKHWKDDRSAKALATAWETAHGLPREIRALLKPLGEVELLLAMPEYKVDLPGGSRASQNDVFALLRTPTGLVSAMVEGKVDEPFGPTLEEWRKGMSAGKRTRLAHLCQKLALTETLADSIRYQLLHRAASGVMMAERFHAADAAIIIHSFGTMSELSYADYRAFLRLFGKSAESGQLIQLGIPCGVRLWAGWANAPRRK